MFFKRKKVNNDAVPCEANNFNMEVIGEDTEFEYLSEIDMKIHKKSFMRICRCHNGKKYWEFVKPYEIINNNLCVRSKSDIPEQTGWIVFTKKELEKLLENMKE